MLAGLEKVACGPVNPTIPKSSILHIPQTPISWLVWVSQKRGGGGPTEKSCIQAEMQKKQICFGAMSAGGGAGGGGGDMI